jgi:4-diphosphocytidyl-2-C-methyl-D-erythritol kinase
VTIALAARAKLNLDLEVLGKRGDGFHEIRTRIQAVELHDLIELAPASRTTIEITGQEVSNAGDNSVLKAHLALERAVGQELPTKFLLHKRIPPGSGLGGASSDAAAALRGLAALHRLTADLGVIASTLGADIPFFLEGGSARAEGRGERLTPLPIERSWFVIAWPGIELSTAAVYGAWEEVKGEPPNHLRRSAISVEPRIQDFATRLGEGWQMTGSGSAFFKRCASQEQARQVATRIDCWTAVTQTVGRWVA